MLGDDILTPEFWPCVDQLTLQLTTLLLPLVRVMDKHFPASRVQSLRSLHQDLHAIVAEAGYLSIGIRRSRDVFRFSSPFPGQVWDLDQQHVNDTVYNASKAAAEKADMDAEAKWKTERSRQTQPAVHETSPTITEQGRALLKAAASRAKSAWNHFRGTGQAEEEPKTNNQAVPNDFWHPPSRVAKVQVILWPMLQRFATVGEIDPNTGAADSEAITTLLKAQVVYYCGRADQHGEQGGDHRTLEEWVWAKKQERIWAFLRPLRWFVYAAGIWLFLSFVARYSTTVGDIQEAVGHRLLAMIKAVARGALLLVIEALIVVVSIAIGLVNLSMFFAYALGNGIARLLGLGNGWLWKGPGGDGGGFALPEFTWQSFRGMAKAVAGDFVWKTVTFQVPAGYARDLRP